MGVRPIRNVLFVDDDERVLAGWRRGAGRDRVVWTTSDPVTARQLAKKHVLDLAVVDLKLGRASGIDLVRELRMEQADLQIALCSGYLSVDTTVAAVRAGADVIVFKPITFKEVLRRLAECDEDPDIDDTPTLARAEWEHIMRVLADSDGNVTVAARRLGIYRSSLQRRLRKYAPRD